MSSGNRMPSPSDWLWIIVMGWLVMVLAANLGGCVHAIG